MWVMIAIISAGLAALVLVWRVVAAGRQVPDENSRSRQHEVPGVGDRPRTLPDWAPLRTRQLGDRRR